MPLFPHDKITEGHVDNVYNLDDNHSNQLSINGYYQIGPEPPDHFMQPENYPTPYFIPMEYIGNVYFMNHNGYLHPLQPHPDNHAIYQY